MMNQLQCRLDDLEERERERKEPVHFQVDGAARRGRRRGRRRRRRRRRLRLGAVQQLAQLDALGDGCVLAEPVDVLPNWWFDDCFFLFGFLFFFGHRQDIDRSGTFGTTGTPGALMYRLMEICLSALLNRSSVAMESISKQHSRSVFQEHGHRKPTRA